MEGFGEFEFGNYMFLEGSQQSTHYISYPLTATLTSQIRTAVVSSPVRTATIPSVNNTTGTISTR